MANYVITSGQTSSVLNIGSGDTLTVLNGGVADKPNVLTSGIAKISSGGVALMPMVSGGRVNVYSGGCASNTVVSSGGTLMLYIGASANHPVVNSYGYVGIVGGFAASAGVNTSNTTLELIEGSARYTSVGIASGAPASNWRARFVVSIGSALDTTVYSGGTMVLSGGTAIRTSVSKGGLVSAAGGTMYDTLVSGGRVQAVMCTLSRTTIAELFGQEGVAVAGNSAVLADVEVNSGGKLRVAAGGSASGVNVIFGGTMEIAGQATGIDIHRLGTVTVSKNTYSAGTATNVAFWGESVSLNVSRGGVVSGLSTCVSTNMTFTGSMDMRGKMYDAVLYHSGDLKVQSGGMAVRTKLTRNGTLNISSGGTALDTVLTNAAPGSSAGGGSGALNIFAGGVAENTTVEFAAFQVNVSSGGTALGTLLSESAGGKLNVYSGGTALDTQVQNSCYMSVFDGGFASGGEVRGGRLFVASSGSISDMTAGGWGWSLGEISLAGHASNLRLGYSGWAQVSGTVNGATIENGGHLYAHNGFVSNVTVSSGGYLRISSGGSCVGNTAKFGARIYVSNGGEMSSAAVSSGASFTVESGGTATAVTADSGANLMFDVASNTFVQGTCGGSAFELKDSLLTGFTVNPGDALNVKNGCSALEIRENGGYVDVAYGAVATFVSNSYDGLVISHSESATVHSGTTAVGTEVHSSGIFRVFSGGCAREIKEAGGYVEIESGANVTFASNSFSSIDLVRGDATVHSGTTAIQTSVGNNGRLLVYEGGTATSTTVGSGGSVLISGGTVGGLSIDKNGAVIPYAGAEINFNLVGRSTDDSALINDYTRILGGSPSYTITVSGNQNAGSYKLAEKAGGFNHQVTIGISGGSSTDISVGGTVTLGSRVYSLNLVDQSLNLTVSSDPTQKTAGDLNMDGRADIIMTIDQPSHPSDGATGAWLIQENQTPAWGDLSTRSTGWTVFGTGKTAAGKNTDDVYIKNGDNIVGAWTTGDNGLVTGWETIGEFAGDAQVLGLGDFNGNGQSDLLLRAANGAVGCFFTNGQGWNYFQSLGEEWKLCAIGDFNGDGRSDVVLKHGAGFAGSWLTQSDGTPLWADLDTLPDGFEIVGAGDFNGDGTDDVLLKNAGYYGAWLVNNGNAVGWFGIGDLGDATVEQIADFNGDGKDDLRIRTSAGDLGAELVMGADTLDWHYYGSVGAEWKTGLAALS